ncbi:MAG: PP2C family protein-serine/threonine phosphatase [candidate division KSB1 bacterium]|nr:PP2C family protein-serine/threonine phosphatase [candidate division KSB1 bacterium]
MDRRQRSKQLLFDIGLAIAAAGAVAVLLVWAAEIFPWGGWVARLSPGEVEQVARQAVAELEVDITRYRHRLTYRTDPIQIRYLAERFGTARANRFARGWIPVHYWQVEWSPPGRIEQMVFGLGQRPSSLAEARDWPVRAVQVRVTDDGRVLACRASYAPATPGGSMEQGEAERLAVSVASAKLGAQWGSFGDQEVSTRHAERRLDYTFRWRERERPAGEQVEFFVELAGEKLAGYGWEYKVPPAYAETPTLARATWVPALLLYLGMTVLVLFVLIKKLRADEITFRAGLPFALLGASALSLRFVLAQHEQWLVEVGVALVLLVPLDMLLLLVLVSTADSTAREVWPDKLLSLDALRAGRIAHRRFGLAMARGVAVGLTAAGLATALFKLASLVTRFYFHELPLTNNEITARLPALYSFAVLLSNVLFVAFALVLFLPSFLARYSSDRWRIGLLGTVLWAVGALGDGPFAVWPLWLALVVKVAVAGVILAAFFCSDFLTAAIGFLSCGVALKGLSLATAGNMAVRENGIALLLLLPLMAVIGLVASRRKAAEGEPSLLAPAYVRRLNERLRLQRELDVARRVQLSFLPRALPQVPGLEIASSCVPANEVGGDYYDFVVLGPEQLGVAVGDVSGKGISAAFYMTLTKGFFRSQARAARRPREVLIRVNELFCENAERGHFVSMVYAVFDTGRGLLRLARAGHNPVVVGSPRRNQAEVLCPPGIALGLTSGPLFAQVIEEVELVLHPGDCFVFYTDGYTEAMDRRNEEFGEERLWALVAEQARASAHEAVQVIERRVRSFMGGMPRHDDMTIVVVKVREQRFHPR